MSNSIFNGIEVKLDKTLENIKLPEPELLEYYNNLNERTIWIDYEIDDAIIEVSKMILRFNKEDVNIPIQDRKPIKLLLFTYGGSVDVTFQLIDVIRLSKTPVYTYNMGVSMSAGFQILISGHKRFCLPNSIALYHSGSGKTSGTYEQTEAQMKEYKRSITVFEQLTLAQTKIDAKTFSKNKTKEWYMDVNDQLKYGIVDSVITDLDQVYLW